MKKTQAGMSLTGFLVGLAVVGFALYLGMKLIPMYQEYWSVKKAVQGVAQDDAVPADPVSVRQALAKYFDVGYVGSVKPENIKVERAGDASVISVDYEVRRPLIYNLDIVGKFSASEEKRTGAR
jgi:hypothetical protein